MLVRMTRLFPVLTAVLALACFSQPAFSQTPGGRTALAAKQHLKNAVLDAMSDGKISKLERAEIVAEAKEVLTVKEYEGLIATMDRLSPPEKTTAVAKHNTKERAKIASVQQDQQSDSFFGRMMSHVPYVDDLSIGPHPQVSNVAKVTSAIPYIKTSSADSSDSKQATAKTTKPKDTYLEMPSAERLLPRITRVERPSASHRATVKQDASDKKTAAEKKSLPKYVDESILPLPPEPNAVEKKVAQLPKKAKDETKSAAESPDSNAMVTPTGALLPDRVPTTQTGYTKPQQPKSVELEFLR